MRPDARLTLVALRFGIKHPRLSQTGGGPAPDDRVSPSCQTADRDFECQRRDVLVREGVGLDIAGIHPGRGEFFHRILDVYQIKGFAEIDDEPVHALPHEHLARRVAAGDRDGVDETVGIVGVVGDGFSADVVQRLGEGGAAVAGVDNGLRLPVAPVTAHERERIALYHVLSAHVRCRDGPDIRQRHRDRLAARLDRESLALVGEAELEREVFDAVTIVVDVDLIQRVRIHKEVVRSPVGVLQRLVVGDERHEARPPGLVAAEHVEIGAIHFRMRCDERCLPVTRRLNR